LVERRKEIVEGVRDLVGGVENAEAEARLTSDVEFEDPFQLYKVTLPPFPSRAISFSVFSREEER